MFVYFLSRRRMLWESYNLTPKRRFIKRLSLWTLKLSLVIFCLVFVIAPFIYKYLYALQRSLVYLNFVSWPRNPNFSDPSAYKIEGVRNLYLTTDEDVRLGVWQILPEDLVKNDTDLTTEYFEDALKDGRDVIIYNHGNSGHRLAEHRMELYHLLRKKYHVICWDYRGYGDSSDIEPTETGLVSDAKFVYKWVLNQTTSNIFLWGHSLGTGVSTHMLGDLSKENIKKPRGLILESPFNSFTDEIAEHPFAKLFRPLPWFHYTIIDPMLQNGFVFASDKHIIKVDCPILILHAEDDLVVPYSLGKKLYETAQDFRRSTQGNVTFVGFETKFNYGHKYICRAPELPEMIDNFFITAAKESEDKKL